MWTYFSWIFFVWSKTLLLVYTLLEFFWNKYFQLPRAALANIKLSLYLFSFKSYWLKKASRCLSYSIDISTAIPGLIYFTVFQQYLFFILVLNASIRPSLFLFHPCEKPTLLPAPRNPFGFRKYSWQEPSVKFLLMHRSV